MPVPVPTIIVFAREPVPGRSKTRLIPALGPRGAAFLARAFIVDAVAKASRLRPPRLIIAADRAGNFISSIAWRLRAELADQGRGDLGRRMARALTPHLRGPGAILLGTDTPTMPLALLRQSASQLAACDLVVSPALDGGYYLIGARGSLPDIFSRVEWGGPAVLAQTLVRARKLGVSYQIGPWWYDIDRPRDLSLLRAELAGRFCPAGRALRAACPATIKALADMDAALREKSDLGGRRLLAKVGNLMNQRSSA